jgi:hypothetical protein
MASRNRTSYEPYPGETHDMDSEEVKAVLDTPNGASVAWLFI